MHAIAIDRNGGPDVLVSHDLPVPEPNAGEALVRVEAIGVNFIDVYFRKGTYKAPAFPFVPGNEAAGVVERVGAGVTRVAPGDRVAYATVPGGAYAQYATAPVDRLVKVPDGVSSRDAAALMLQGMTAHYLCTSTYPLAAGETALVHAGAGGVGLLLTQLAKAKGATVITTVSTPEKAALSTRAGADRTIEYTRENFGEEVRRLTGGRGVDVVYDSVGLTTWEASPRRAATARIFRVVRRVERSRAADRSDAPDGGRLALHDAPDARELRRQRRRVDVARGRNLRRRRRGHARATRRAHVPARGRPTRARRSRSTRDDG